MRRHGRMNSKGMKDQVECTKFSCSFVEETNKSEKNEKKLWKDAFIQLELIGVLLFKMNS